MRRPALPLLLAAALTACAGGGADSPDVVRADSAGVELVTSGATDRELPWRFERRDVLRDSLGEPWLFTGVSSSSVAVDGSGRTLALAGGRSIVRFAAEGSMDRTFGGQGNGPGEMQFPTALGMQGDTLFALDVMQNALVRWGPDLAPIPNLPLTGALSGAQSIAFHSDGLWIHKRDFTDGVYTLTLQRDTLGAPPLHRVVQPPSKMIRMCNGGISLPPFFSPEIRWAAQGASAVSSAGTDYVVWVHAGGRTFRSVRRAITPRAPVPADADLLYPTGFTVMFGGGSAPCEMTAAAVFEQAGAAPLLPLVQGLALLPDGTLWVQRTLRGDPSPTLDVFDAEGAYLGTVRDMQLPAGQLPDGDLIVPQDDEDTGGVVLVRLRVTRQAATP